MRRSRLYGRYGETRTRALLTNDLIRALEVRQHSSSGLSLNGIYAVSETKTHPATAARTSAIFNQLKADGYVFDRLYSVALS